MVLLQIPIYNIWKQTWGNGMQNPHRSFCLQKYVLNFIPMNTILNKKGIWERLQSVWFCLYEVQERWNLFMALKVKTMITLGKLVSGKACEETATVLALFYFFCIQLFGCAQLMTCHLWFVYFLHYVCFSKKKKKFLIWQYFPVNYNI
jgi:hypothetical protein